jgi:hypothetical protein
MAKRKVENQIDTIVSLALGSRPRQKGLQGCRPRGSPGVKAKRPQRCGPKGNPGVTSHTPGNIKMCEGVWGSEHSHSQGNSHFGRWSLRGRPKLQRVILGVKTQWLVAFFISLESSWNLDVYNRLALLIQTFETQVMAKRRAKSQTANLTPDQKKSGIDPIYLVANNVSHTVEKLSTRATTLLEIAPRSEVCSQSYGVPKSRESPLAQFRDSHSGVPGEKSHLDVGFVASHRV